MALIRGSSLLSSARFVREIYGPEAYDRVLAALPAETCARILGPLREASWEPLDLLVAYMETAKSLLAPDDPAFFKKMGAYAGQLLRHSELRRLLGDDPQTALGRATVLWRSFYDVGRPEVVSNRPGDVVVRIVEFAAPSHALCERIEGFWEACLDVQGMTSPRVHEQACVLRGAPHCELRVTWNDA